MRVPATPFMPSSMFSAWIAGLGGLGVQPVQVSSQARDRKEYLSVPTSDEYWIRLQSIC